MAALIPYPASLRRRPGTLLLARPLLVSATPEVAAVADWMIETLGGMSATTGAAIRLALDDRLAPEGYRLTVDGDGVVIEGGVPAGVFYGAQTLRQLLPAESPGDTVTLPHLEVTDEPRFGWRGAMLDVARHFMPKEFVLRFIDLLALHKLNVLHLHLTDDQGWRLQIPRHRRLTEVRAWRDATLAGHSQDRPKRHDGARHGGYYTQQDIREIVAYAAERFVTVVPEIDSPGHSQAAIVAYPEFGNTGEQLQVWTDWGISEHVLNVSGATLDFYRDVLDDVMRLFHGPYLLLGGDECPTGERRANPDAVARVRVLGLPDQRALLGWFVRQLAGFATTRGRRPVFWYDTGAAAAAQREGHDVVLTSHEHLSLDYYQSESRDVEPLAIGGHTPLELMHAFDAGEPPGTLGAQCQLRTEHMPRPDAVGHMAFPRLCAFSEAVCSTPSRAPYAGFHTQRVAHLAHLTALSVARRPLNQVATPRQEAESHPSGGTRHV